MSNLGIDWGNGITNIDIETGIRYGVISVSSLCEWVYDMQEYDYGEPTCPKCGGSVIDPSDESIEDGEWNIGKDCACPECKQCFWSDECYPMEALGWSISNGDYRAYDCLDSDCIVLKSRYFTYAAFCSPCVPGAGNLDSPADNPNDGARCYCFGHEMFDGDIAPYTVYSVETGEIVLPEGR